MTFRHRAGVSPHTSRRRFARTCVFGKQSHGPFLCGSLAGAMLIPKLRMYVAEFLDANSSAAFAFSARPPVSVCGTVGRVAPSGCFSPPRTASLRLPRRGAPSALASDRLLTRSSQARAFRGPFRAVRRRSPCVSPHRRRGRRGNVDPLPVDYGPHPRLRGRLTLGQIAFTLETSGFRRRGIPPLFHVTHACILSAAPSTTACAAASPVCGMLSYRPPLSGSVPRLRLRA